MGAGVPKQYAYSTLEENWLVVILELFSVLRFYHQKNQGY